MDLLKRAQAPVTEEAWEQIEEETRRTLKANLSARWLMDVEGPHGPQFAALNLGRMAVPKNQSKEAVRYGLRQVQPLIELRASFTLDQWELDNASRGAEDVDLDPAADAAREMAHFEERAIYEGLPEAGITSLRQASVHSAIKLGAEGLKFAEPISKGLVTLRQAGIDGPYGLVLGPKPYERLASVGRSCPTMQHIEHLIGGPLLLSPVLEGGFLISMRGGDFQLVLGLDASLGWESHEGGSVTLFLTESFTFRTLEPRAVVPFVE